MKYLNLPILRKIEIGLLALALPASAAGQAGGSTSGHDWSDFDKAFGSKPRAGAASDQMTGSPAASLDKPTPEPMPPPSGASGKIEYMILKDPNPPPELTAEYAKIDAAMRKAVWYYENYTTNLRGKRLVMYLKDVPTADANFQGPIRFGGSCNVRVAMHELMHTFGIGTTDQWQHLMKDGVFTGRHATDQMRAITGDPKAVVHGDHQHFWPYGLNYDTEVKSDDDLIRHCLMVEAIRRDLDEVH